MPAMPLSATQHFDAYLPNLTHPVRIASFDDAKVFARRWAIRDKDRTLKALIRRMEKANSSETTDSAIHAFKQALRTRGLLSGLAEGGGELQSGA
jgi:hypothetical protein